MRPKLLTCLLACLAVAAALCLNAVTAQASSHRGIYANQVANPLPVCGVDVQEHLLLPTLALNEAAILRYAGAELSGFGQWWHGLAAAAALATDDPLKGNDTRLLNASSPAHSGMHERLRRVLHIAQAANWPGLSEGFAERVEAKLTQPQADARLWLLLLLLGLPLLFRRRPGLNATA